jgi:DNA-binding CsgD family transcriptional regulator
MPDLDEAVSGRKLRFLLPTPDRSSVQTEYEVLRLMRQCAAEFDFDNFMIVRMPAGDQQSFAERLVVSSWPTELVRTYDALDLFRTSRLVAELRHTKLPVFAETSALLGLRGKPLSGVDIAPGMAGTLAALFHTTYADPYIVTLSGARGAPEGSEAAEVYFVLLQLFERLERAMDAGVTTREKLSAREVECLRWAAAGKSSDEIAIILGISAYTVSSYFKTAARKLDAVNRMQAIARAMRLKII